MRSKPRFNFGPDWVIVGCALLLVAFVVFFVCALWAESGELTGVVVDKVYEPAHYEYIQNGNNLVPYFVGEGWYATVLLDEGVRRFGVERRRLQVTEEKYAVLRNGERVKDGTFEDPRPQAVEVETHEGR